MNDLKFDADSARVRAKAVGLDLAFAGSFDALRGALSVWTYLARLPFPTPGHEAFVPWMMWSATTQSKRARTGFAVVVADMAAFIPQTFPPPSAAATAVGLAVNLLTLPLGIAMVPSYVTPPIAEVLTFFYAAPLSVRLFVIEALTRLMGGWAVGVAHTHCTAMHAYGAGGMISVEAEGREPISGQVSAEMAHALLRRLPTFAATPSYR